MSPVPRLLILDEARRMRKAGVPDPAEDAALLLSALIGREPLTLRLDTDTELPPETVEAFRALCAKRRERIPLQWLTGCQLFLGRTFRVGPDVLIPRPETALLAERAIHRAGEMHPGSLLDLCCGSGCIAVSCAISLPAWRIDASDLSEAALRTANENANMLGAHIRFFRGDLFSPLDGMRYDIIVSNPPYIPSDDCLSLQEEVKMEPIMALDGGTDGLDFYRVIAAESARFLNPGGILLLEIGIGQDESVPALLKQNGFIGVYVLPDFNGIPRIVEACLPEDTP